MNKKKWEEIQKFAKKLIDLTEKDEDTWASHAVSIIGRCPCFICAKHSLYTNVVDALEQWENKRDAKDTRTVETTTSGNSPGCSVEAT